MYSTKGRAWLPPVHCCLSLPDRDLVPPQRQALLRGFRAAAPAGIVSFDAARLVINSVLLLVLLGERVFWVEGSHPGSSPRCAPTRQVRLNIPREPISGAPTGKPIPAPASPLHMRTATRPARLLLGPASTIYFDDAFPSLVT